MGSIHRIGVTIASLATALVVGGVFVAQGYAEAQQATPTPPAAADVTADPTATPSLAPETIYINPVPTPEVVSVTQTAAPVKKNPPVIHVVVTPPPGQGDDDHEGSDD